MLTQCLEIKARGCCMHVFLVLLLVLSKTALSHVRGTVSMRHCFLDANSYSWAKKYLSRHRRTGAKYFRGGLSFFARKFLRKIFSSVLPVDENFRILVSKIFRNYHVTLNFKFAFQETAKFLTLPYARILAKFCPYYRLYCIIVSK